jgi:hypothetical protein
MHPPPRRPGPGLAAGLLLWAASCGGSDPKPGSDEEEGASSATGVALSVLADDSTLSRTLLVTTRGRARVDDDALEGIVNIVVEDVLDGSRCTDELALVGTPSERCPDCDWAFDLSPTLTVDGGCAREPVTSLLGGWTSAGLYSKPGLGWIEEESTVDTTSAGRTETTRADQLFGIFELSLPAYEGYDYTGGWDEDGFEPSTRVLPVSYRTSTVFTPYVPPDSTDSTDSADSGAPPDSGAPGDTGAPVEPELVEGEPVVSTTRRGSASLVGSALQWTVQRTMVQSESYDWCEDLDGYGTFGGTGGGLGRAPRRASAVSDAAAVTGVLPCRGTAVDIWTLEATAGEELTLLLDTVDPATTFDGALYVATAERCILAYGDDEHDCTFPPASYGCPSARVRAPEDGVLHVVVQSLGVCASREVDYRLMAERAE